MVLLFKAFSGRRRTPRVSGSRNLRPRFRPKVEVLEQRDLLTIVVPTPGTMGQATITGTSAADQFIIRLQAGMPANIQFSDDGGATFTTSALSDITNVVVSGLAGDDRLTIDNGNGLVGKPSGLPISYAGGPGVNVLSLGGNPNGPSLNESYSAGTSSNAGSVNTNSATSFQMVSFVNLTRINDTVPVANLVVTANDNPNYIAIINGDPSAGLNTTRVVGIDRSQINTIPDVSMDSTIGGGHMDLLNQAFVPMDFANKISVSVNAGGGDDFVVLNNPTPAAGLAQLTLDGGTGSNLAAQRVLPPGVSINAIRFTRVDINQQAIFIDELYELRLYRAPAISELAIWVNGLNNGLSAAQVAAGIDNSTEGRTRLVQFWYLRYLGRQVVGGEADGWINMLLQGASEEQVLAQILGSGEFFNRASTFFNTGNANENYIRTLYLLLLNRTAASSEVDGWLAAIPTLGRTSVAQMFLLSSEFRTDMVTAFYDGILHRNPDSAGLNAWVASGLLLSPIRQNFLSSAEFINNG